MRHHAQAGVGDGLAHHLPIVPIRSGGGSFNGQVDKVQPESGNAFDLLHQVPSRVVHRTKFHCGCSFCSVSSDG
jgi:hypothetical protein